MAGENRGGENLRREKTTAGENYGGGKLRREETTAPNRDGGDWDIGGY